MIKTLLLLLLCHVSRAELFTAVVHLEQLLETERQIAESLQRYIAAEESRLEQLKHLVSSFNIRDLSNPVNAFLLVKRLTLDWNQCERLMREQSPIVAALQNETFPSHEDLTGAAEALLRLQTTYKLTEFSTAQLTANDCFELGRHSYANDDFRHTLLWMNEAMERLRHETVKSADKSQIIEYLAFASYKMGNVRNALRLTQQLLTLVPDHPRALGNVQYYRAEEEQKRGDDGSGDVPIDAAVIEARDESERDVYEALCRGEERLDSGKRRLLCFHLDTRHIPFLRLTRVRVEEAYRKPQIVVFHSFLSDSEIETIKTLAQPKLKRATVQNSVTGQLETAKYRISKSAWLTNGEHPVVARVSRRVQHVTGLDVSTAEELQVVNYGIGGHYEPHYDFARREETDAFKSLGTGNRIATLLNYMSDVEAGGATVFPVLGVAIRPEKGSAAFWYNLHRSGDGDLLTRHAACPVLIGSKWVSNKWLHERGQEFRRTCSTRINEYNIIQDIH